MLKWLVMLLVGLFAGTWGFMMCFLPGRWDRLTEAMNFAGRWAEPGPNRPHPLMRLVHRVAGLVILAVGCSFAYVAASEIYLVLTRGAATHAVPPSAVALPNSPTPALTALAVVVIAAGILMAGFPAKAMVIFSRVWPARSSATPSAASKVMLFVRFLGAFFIFLALMSLMTAGPHLR